MICSFCHLVSYHINYCLVKCFLLFSYCFLIEIKTPGYNLMIYVVKIAGSEQENSKGGAGVVDKALFSRHLDFGALFVCLFESRYIFDKIFVLLSSSTIKVI